MGNALVRLAKANQQEEEKPPLHPDEKKALEKLQQEAKKSGASLETEGEGGLPPSLVLGVMRRDKFECKMCGSNKNLSVHHKGGIPGSNWLKKKGHTNDPNNIVTICEGCHDKLHEEQREKESEK